MNDQVSRVEGAVVSGQRPRAAFLARTYNHLLGAIVAFIGIEVVLFQTGAALKIAQVTASVPWLVVLGVFMGVSWLFTNMAESRGSVATQYLGLGGYVLAFALLSASPLAYAWYVLSPGVVKNAAIFTLVAFMALTAIVYYTRKDFTFLKPLMMWGGILALVLIVMSYLIGFQLGMLFIVAMVAYCGAAILYSTSSVMRDYPDGFHVAAALALFASVIMLFWYILQLVMSLSGE